MTAGKKKNSENKGGFLNWSKRRIRIVLIVVCLLIIARIILPYVVLHYANKTLANMDGYYGHVQDIDLAIYRGAYKMIGLYINKEDSSGKHTPFFESRIIDLSVQWRALFHGRLVGELEFQNPALRFTKDKAEPLQVQKDSNDFRIILKKFMPLKVNRFEVFRGVIRYVDESSSPKVDVNMYDTYVLAQNLSNVKDTSLLPASVMARSELYGGKLEFNMRLNPLADDPAFDMNAELKNTDLKQL